MSFCSPCNKFKNPIVIVMGLLLIGLLVGSTAFLNDYRASLLEDRKLKTQKLIDNALDLMTYYQEKIEKGEMSDEKAKNYALTTIRQIATEPNGYFWILGTDTKGIMHPFQQPWDGHDLSTYKGPDKRNLFVEMVDMARTQEGGFISYLWPKPGEQDRFFDKTSYLKIYRPWQWIIGTGVYIDDIDAAFMNIALIIFGIVLAVLAFSLALAMTVSESLKTE